MRWGFCECSWASATTAKSLSQNLIACCIRASLTGLSHVRTSSDAASYAADPLPHPDQGKPLLPGTSLRISAHRSRPIAIRTSDRPYALGSSSPGVMLKPAFW